jgi:hypothetical protein
MDWAPRNFSGMAPAFPNGGVIAVCLGARESFRFPAKDSGTLHHVDSVVYLTNKRRRTYSTTWDPWEH